MKLWLLLQQHNTGYDTYDAAVVAAETAEAAQKINIGSIGDYGSWAAPEHVTARLIGDAVSDTAEGIIIASFNAG